MSHRRRRSRRASAERRRVIQVGSVAALALAVAAVVLLVLQPAGFPLIGADQDPSSSATPRASGSTVPELGQPTGSSAGPDQPGASTDAGDDGILTSSDLEGFALRGSDLAVGWFPADQAVPAVEGLLGACLRKAVRPAAGHAALASGFRRGTSGPALGATVRDFTLVAAARASFRREAAAIRSCVSRGAGPSLRTARAATGADAEVVVSFAVRRDGGAGRGLVIVARVDQRTLTVVVFGATEEDLAEGRKAARTVVERIS